jgi:hypothetical protein
MSGGGLVGALAAFEAIRKASAGDALLRTGRAGLPASEADARQRALRIVEVLDEAQIARPDRLVVLSVSTTPDGERRWHVAPVYPVKIGKGERIEAVADPFLRRAPLEINEWMGQLGAGGATYLFPEVLITERDEALTPPVEIEVEPRSAADITTRRGGSGTQADSEGLAKLLRAWLADPSDPTRPQRFRSLFGEVTWRALQHAQPELMREVELLLEKLSRSTR